MNRKTVLMTAIAVTLTAGAAGGISLHANAARSPENNTSSLAAPAVQTHAASILPMTAMAALSAGASSASEALQPRPMDGFSILVNGRTLELDAPPHMAGDTILVPLRNIAEALGAQVEYQHTDGTVTAFKEGIRMEFRLDSSEAIKNGSVVSLAAPPVRVGDTTMVPLRAFSEAFGTVVKWDGRGKQAHIDEESYLLPSLGSAAKLRELLEQQPDHITVTYPPLAITANSESTMNSPQADTAAASKEKSSYSSTNVQVQGVDEADVVKTDGDYLYQVNGNRIMIAKAGPSGQLALEANIDLSDDSFTPSELYVDGNRLVVIGNSSMPVIRNPEITPQDNQDEPDMPVQSKRISIIPFQSQPTTKMLVYDITDRKRPAVTREMEAEGRYITSRKIGSQVYMITNRYLDKYRISTDERAPEPPSFKDSASSGQWSSIPYGDIRYFPDSTLSSYITITGVDTEASDKPAQVGVYLGSADNVYASANSLFIAYTEHRFAPLIKQSAGNADGIMKETAVVDQSTNSTILKFLMEDGGVRFTAKGQVPGNVLNQFSMDENNGFFRIATTTGEVWRTDEGTSKNNLYILDESLNTTGKIEDIAPGEQIYSVRFMGNRGYMVTFKNVDPLFALDLSNPYSPSVLGQLKIPGYSDYLHPYDENHLIGFGKDAVEVPVKNGTGNPQTTAYYQGMKLSMFDVTDVSQPKELFQTVIGDRGTDSELLRNHKALLFSREKNLLAFPVTVASVKEAEKSRHGASAYGQFSYQGAYVYRVDLKDGFQLRGAVTHLTDDELMKAGSSWYGSRHQVERALYIGDTLYTLSKGQIRANHLDSLKEISRLELP